MEDYEFQLATANAVCSSNINDLIKKEHFSPSKNKVNGSKYQDDIENLLFSDEGIS